MASEIGIGLAVVGLGLGLRHGIDWDHIAAITDVTSAQPSRLRGFVMGTLYALGHATVVVILGLLAILTASQLPDWIDAYMKTLVGITLITLGIWVFYSLIHNPDDFKLKSRWMLLFATIRSASRWVKTKVTGREYASPELTSSYYGVAASTGIGMIHGVGAETGSQALLLAAAAGATSTATGSFLLIFFSVGLVLSNSLITITSIMGLLGSQGHKYIYTGLGILIGTFSLIVGVLFLLQKDSLLPGLFA